MPSPLPYLNTVIDQCESTNELTKQLAHEGHPHGSWVSARTQNSGRGRRGRSWQSPNGNLYLSVLIRVLNPALTTWIPLTAGASTCDFLVRHLKPLEVRIKWPNDLWIKDRKLGGILCEGVGIGDETFVIIGIGLNCQISPKLDKLMQLAETQTLSPSQALDSQAAAPVATNLITELNKKGMNHLGQLATADHLRPLLIQTILTSIDDLNQKGPKLTQERYSQHALFTPGAQVTWGEGISGSIHGLGEFGQLLVLSEGKIKHLYAEDVSIRPC